MIFGYFNRNWEEELAIPPGPDNTIEPGGPDRGQPTFFLPRRQGWVFRVRVPKDFGKQVITWTITANGKTNKAYGELLPTEEITERIVMTRGNLNPGENDPNKAPAINIAPVQDATVTSPVALAAMVQDDGLPKPRVPVVKPTSATDATKIQAQAELVGPGPSARSDGVVDATARAGEGRVRLGWPEAGRGREGLDDRAVPAAWNVCAARDGERRIAGDENGHNYHRHRYSSSSDNRLR